MKLEVGMYVRTEKGIYKINYFINNNYTQKFTYIDNKGVSNILEEKEIIKASHNIIDLIEVGDVITFKEDNDVYKVLHIPNKKCGLKDFYLVKNYDGQTEDIFVEYNEMKKYINSIVTKEQFESVSYKL